MLAEVVKKVKDKVHNITITKATQWSISRTVAIAITKAFIQSSNIRI